MRPLAARLALFTLVLGLVLTGCSKENTPEDGASQDAVVVDVTIADGTVTPAGDRVKVSVGQPVTFNVEADAPGELHVHSEPEHSMEFDAGTTSDTFTIDKPGVVEVELHDPDVVVVQLQVQ